MPSSTRDGAPPIDRRPTRVGLRHFVLAQGVFTHAPLADIAACTAAAASCMGPDAVFLATYIEGDTDYEGRVWRYPQTSWYTAARMAHTAAESGLVTVPVRWRHPRGARWLALCRPARAAELRDMVAGLPQPRRPGGRPTGGARRRSLVGSFTAPARCLAASVKRRLRGAPPR